MSTASLVSVRCVTALLSVGAATLPFGGAQAEPSREIAAILAEYEPSPRLSMALLIPLRSDIDVKVERGADASLVRLPKSTIVETGAPVAEPATVTQPQLQTAAVDTPSKNVDPDFPMWQRRAQDKLQLEGAPKSYEHPLAKDNPNDFIVVCEAGCIRQPDEVVSRIAKPDRVASRATPSALDDSDAPQSTMPAVEIDPSAIRCEAGCSGLQKIHRARLPRTATADPVGDAGRSMTAANGASRSERRLIAPQSASNGAIVGPYFAPRAAETKPEDNAPSTPSQAPRATRIMRSDSAPIFGRRVVVLPPRLRRVAEFRH